MADNSNRTSNQGPRVSHVTTKAFTSGPGHYLFPSWMTVEVDGPFNADGLVTSTSGLSTSRLTVSGAANVSGTFSATGAVANSGNVANTGTWALGTSGTSFSAIRASTFSMVAGTVAPQDSATTTATISLMPADAVVIGLQPASQWSGAYYDISYTAHVSAASTLLVAFQNSTITSVAPALINWTLAYIDPS